MEGKRLLRSIQLTNLLSYGSSGSSISLEPLNVLIGPNASGKSNLIEALTLLAAAPRDLLKPIREGGGITEWLWKGRGPAALATLQTISADEISHSLALSAVRQRTEIVAERLESLSPEKLFYDFRNGTGTIQSRTFVSTTFKGKASTSVSLSERSLSREDISIDQSVLSQRRDPDVYPELTRVADQFGSMRFFREWNFGRSGVLRRPQPVDLPDEFLLEDGSNLGLVLNDLQNRRSTKKLILDNLRLFYERVEDITTKTQGGTIQIFLHEEGLGDQPIPAYRLSDGTLHFLCLLTILLHPEPPQLICIEEPELGLHPDVLPALAKLLIDASQRTQLIVTTHSEALVSALSETPEAVVVCERGDEGTTLRRLEPEKLKEWLERYRLGELWSMGEIGGNRW